MQPIIDKAEVAIDFPDKAYIGTFSRSSSFDVSCDSERVRLRLAYPGADHRTADIHLHYYLLCDILAALADALEGIMPVDEAHRSELENSVRRLERVLIGRRKRNGNTK